MYSLNCGNWWGGGGGGGIFLMCMGHAAKESSGRAHKNWANALKWHMHHQLLTV